MLTDLTEAEVVSLVDEDPQILQESADCFAIPNWFAPGGGHRFEVRGRDATLTCVRGFNGFRLQRRGQEPEHIELEQIDRRYKAGFWCQDQTFLECVSRGGPLPFPGCALDDAVKTLELVDAIAGTGESKPNAYRGR